MKTAWLLLLLPLAAHGACPDAATLCATFDLDSTRIDGPEATSVISLRGLRGKDLAWDIVNKIAPGRADPARIRLVDMGGKRGGVLEVTTLDDDRCVESGSCSPHTWERSEIGFTAGHAEPTDAVDGAEQWWAHSVYLPRNFQIAPGDGKSSIFMQFHNGGRGPAISLQVFNQFGRHRRKVFRVEGKGPNPIMDPYGRRPYSDGTQYHYQAAGAQVKKGQCIHDPVREERWYDFVHYIRWSSNGQGVHRIWMREEGEPLKLVLDKKGISLLYPPGDRSGRNYAFFRIGTYHDPVVPGVSSVRHDRVVRGDSYAAVRMPDMPQALPAGLSLCAGAALDH